MQLYITPIELKVYYFPFSIQSPPIFQQFLFTFLVQCKKSFHNVVEQIGPLGWHSCRQTPSITRSRGHFLSKLQGVGQDTSRRKSNFTKLIIMSLREAMPFSGFLSFCVMRAAKNVSHLSGEYRGRAHEKIRRRCSANFTMHCRSVLDARVYSGRRKAKTFK